MIYDLSSAINESQPLIRAKYFHLSVTNSLVSELKASVQNTALHKIASSILFNM